MSSAMNSRVLLVAGGVVVLGAIGWFGFAGSKPPAAPQAATRNPAEVRPDPAPLAPGAPVATQDLAASAAPSVAPSPAPAGDTRAADERAVLGMYQNMADAVDAYGPTGCAGLGQAFT